MKFATNVPFIEFYGLMKKNPENFHKGSFLGVFCPFLIKSCLSHNFRVFGPNATNLSKLVYFDIINNLRLYFITWVTVGGAITVDLSNFGEQFVFLSFFT